MGRLDFPEKDRQLFLFMFPLTPSVQSGKNNHRAVFSTGRRRKANSYQKTVVSATVGSFAVRPDAGSLLASPKPILDYLKARLLQFIETGTLDAARFQAILTRHGLIEAWQRFEKQFLGDTP